MSRDTSLYVIDMIEACERILRFTKNLDRSDVAAGSMVHDAVLRNLEVLGEAAKRVPAEDTSIRTSYRMAPHRRFA